MKRLMTLCMVLLVTLTLSGCIKKDENVDLRILIPNDYAYLSQLYMDYTHPIIGENVTYNIEVATDLDDIHDAFFSETHDIIYAPVSIGAVYYNLNETYRYAATVTNGEYSLVTEDVVGFTLEDLEGAEIIAYGETSTPGLVLEVLLSKIEFDTAPTITYFASVDEAVRTWEQDQTKYLIVDEYNKQIAIRDKENMQLVDLRSEWEDMSGDETFPDIGIFVKATPSIVVEAYLREVLISIQELNDNTDTVMQMLDGVMDVAEYGIDFDVDAILITLQNSPIELVTASNSKTAFVHCYGYYKEYDPELFGEVYPDKDFYYGD